MIDATPRINLRTYRGTLPLLKTMPTTKTASCLCLQNKRGRQQHSFFATIELMKSFSTQWQCNFSVRLAPLQKYDSIVDKLQKGYRVLVGNNNSRRVRRAGRLPFFGLTNLTVTCFNSIQISSGAQTLFSLWDARIWFVYTIHSDPSLSVQDTVTWMIRCTRCGCANVVGIKSTNLKVFIIIAKWENEKAILS